MSYERCHDVEYILWFMWRLFIFKNRSRFLSGKLAPQPPMKSLISFVPIASLLLQLIPIIGFQVLAFEYVQGEVRQKLYE